MPDTASPEEITDLQYGRTTLVVPRVEPKELDAVAISQAAVGRASQREPLQLLTPRKNAANEFQKIGMNDLEKLRTERSGSEGKGAFVSFPSLGVTAALFANEKEEADAMTELSDQYDFVAL